MKGLTARQVDVLIAIDVFARGHGYPPSFHDLRQILGLRSVNGVNDHLRALKRKGCVTWQPYISRTLRLTDTGRGAL